jgi:trigger factor
MAVEIEELGPCKKKLTITVSKGEVAKQLDQQYKQIANSIALPGFRKGKVPRKILERRYGKSVEQSMTQELVRTALGEAFEEHDLDPIGEPKLELGELDTSADPAFSFEATLQLRPEFELPDLSGIKVSKPPVNVTGTDVDEALASLQRSRGKLTDRAEGEGVADGDLVVTDVAFQADGETKHSEEGLSVWPENDRIGPVEVSDLASKLAGATVGDVIDIPCAIPEQLGVEGENQSLQVTVKQVRTIAVPDLDDGFAASFGCETLDELREQVSSGLTRERERRAEDETNDAVLDAALGRVEFELPEDLIQEELDDMALRAQLQAKYRGASEEDALLEAGKIRTASRDEVAKRLKAMFLLDKLAREKRLFVTEEEIAQRIAGMAMQANKDPQQYTDELVKSGGISRLRHVMRMDKARDYLRAKAEVEEAEAAAAS